MAEIVPDEGLDYLINIVLKAGTPPANLYLGFFTSQTASTVPGSTAVLSTATGVTEAAYTGYSRTAIASGSWGTTGAKTAWSQTGRGSTATQASAPAATASYATAINGFFLASASTGGVAVLYSNFDDTAAVASLAIGDVIRVTPTFALLG